MAATPDGHGYWLVASDGGIFSFGDASLLRVDRGHPAQQADRGHGGDADGGYWLVASDGGIFTLRRRRLPRLGRRHLTLNRPIVGMAATPDGEGYWLVASDGGVYAEETRRSMGPSGTS